MILVNGAETDHIPYNDRGLQYGDGLFETIEVNAGHPVFLKQHLSRLQAGCLKLKLPTPEAKTLTDEIFRACKGSKQAVLKIIITRGIGGRGYRQPEAVSPTRIISLHPFPEYPAAYGEQGITARFCDTRLGLNPALAGIKHLNRLEQVMARAEWDDPGIQEGVMIDLNDCVIEGTMTNLFYVKDDILYTAALEFTGIAGIMRGLIVQLAAENRVSLIEKHYYKKDLLSADEAFFCNCLIGIWPIKQLGDVSFTIGDMTRQIQAWTLQYKGKEQRCAAN